MTGRPQPKLRKGEPVPVEWDRTMTVIDAVPSYEVLVAGQVIGAVWRDRSLRPMAGTRQGRLSQPGTRWTTATTAWYSDVNDRTFDRRADAVSEVVTAWLDTQNM